MLNSLFCKRLDGAESGSRTHDLPITKCSDSFYPVCFLSPAVAANRPLSPPFAGLSFNGIFNGILALVLALSLFPSLSRAQERKAYSIPFRAERGYLLLQTVVNGKQAVLILDTGSPVSFSNGHVLQMHSKGGNVSFRFDDRNPLSAQYYPPDKVAYDGILGNDQLKQFRSVRIDYKNGVVTLEE